MLYKWANSVKTCVYRLSDGEKVYSTDEEWQEVQDADSKGEVEAL